MSRVVGVKQVFVGVKIGGAVDQWIKAGCGIEVDNGHTPDVAGLFDALHICVEIFAAEVLYTFVGLDIFVVGIKERAVEWGEQHNLFVSEHLLQQFHGDVDASAIGGRVEAYGTISPTYELLGLANGSIYHGVAFLIPLSYPYTVVVIVGAYQNDDGIEVVAMLEFQLLCLVGDVIPLTSADAIYKWCDVEIAFQESPIFSWSHCF